MGYMRHHAIIVSSWDHKLLEAAHDKATELGMSVTNITDPAMNRYRSFLVAPDGSKEGWEASELGDLQRQALVEWLDGQRYEDDSTCLGWVEVQFDDDEHESRIVRDSDTKARERYAREAAL